MSGGGAARPKRYRFEASLAAALPAGWVPRETIELTAQGTQTVTASLEPIPLGVDLERYAQGYEEELRRLFPKFQGGVLERAELLGGRRALIRRLRWEAPNGDKVRQLQAYCVLDHWGFVATATMVSEESEGEVLELLEGIRLRSPAAAVAAIAPLIEGSAEFDRYLRGEWFLDLDDDGSPGPGGWTRARQGWEETRDAYR